MKTLKPSTADLVLLCNRQRPDGARKPSCGHHGADALRGWLKGQLKDAGLWPDRARVSAVDCLDICPAAGVVVAFDGGDELLLVDGEADRDALLARIIERAARSGSASGA